MASAQTATTQYIEAKGVRFAYRIIGSVPGVPLIMHIHFRGNMDFWDPALVNALAPQRKVILFDNAGIGKSSGEIPPTYQGWANYMIAFIEALGIEKVDVLGFSMGGCCVQMVALTAPHLVRNLILAGTRPSQGPSTMTNQMDPGPFHYLSNAITLEDFERSIAESFYYWTDEGRAAAKVSWRRIYERTNDRSEHQTVADGAKQTRAHTDFMMRNPNNSFDRLGELKMPVLIANGDNDVLISTVHSWTIMDKIPNAQLIIYPNAGHGFLFQYAKLFAAHIDLFLKGNSEGQSDPESKL